MNLADFSPDSSCSDHLIAALERLQHLAVALSALLLRANHQKVHNDKHATDQDQKGGVKTTGTLGEDHGEILNNNSPQPSSLARWDIQALAEQICRADLPSSSAACPASSTSLFPKIPSKTRYRLSRG